MSVSGNTITAVLEFREMADMKRGRGKLVNRGWTVVKTSGMSVKVTANIN